MHTTIAVEPHSRASRSTTWTRGGQAEPLAADLGRADEAEQAGVAERLQRRVGKGAAIDLGGVLGDDFRRDLFDYVLELLCHGFSGRAVRRLPVVA